MTIMQEDIPYEAPKAVDYTECLAKLNGMVGLAAVKQEISNLAAFLNLQIRRGETNTFQESITYSRVIQVLVRQR